MFFTLPSFFEAAYFVAFVGLCTGVVYAAVLIVAHLWTGGK